MSGKTRLLLVNDNEDFLRAFKRIIEKDTSEFEIKISNEPAKVIEDVRRGEFDCIVSDYRMPGMNGIELLDKVREVDQHIPFILASSDSIHRREAVDRGADDFFLKTSDEDNIHLLVKRVNNVIKSKESESRISGGDFSITDIISHDLRNPLNTAMGHLDLAKDSKSPEDLEKVRKSLVRMNAIIDEVVKLTRDQIGLKTSNFRISDILEETFEINNLKDSSWTINDDLNLTANRDSILRLFENLVSNSIEHNDDSVNVTVGKTEEGFYYEDDGTGIPETSKSDIFRPDYSTKKGGGLGLSIVKRISDIHGWEIDIPDVDQGFRIEFKLDED